MSTNAECCRNCGFRIAKKKKVSVRKSNAEKWSMYKLRKKTPTLNLHHNFEQSTHTLTTDNIQLESEQTFTSKLISQENISIKTEIVPLKSEGQSLLDCEQLENIATNVKVENEFDDLFETTEEFPYELSDTNIAMLTKQEPI